MQIRYHGARQLYVITLYKLYTSSNRVKQARKYFSVASEAPLLVLL